MMAVGLETKTVYATGRTKADILRKLHSEFSSFEPTEAKIQMKACNVYPEPIRIEEMTR